MRKRKYTKREIEKGWPFAASIVEAVDEAAKARGEKPVWVNLRSLGAVSAGPAWLRQMGLQVYAAYTQDESCMLTVKALGRESAKSKLWMINPNLRFYR